MIQLECNLEVKMKLFYSSHQTMLNTLSNMALISHLLWRAPLLQQTNLKLWKKSCSNFMDEALKENRTGNTGRVHAVNPSVISYNIANVQSHERLMDVISVLASKQILVGMLQGTCRRLVDVKRGFDVLDVDGYRCVSFGHLGDWHAGCMICVSLRAFPECDWRRIWVPNQTCTRGRIGMIRLKRPDFDVCFFSAYVPPVDKTGTIRDVVHTVLGDISNAISSRQICPHRSVPILGIDANGHVGMKFSRDTRCWIYTDSEYTGTLMQKRKTRWAQYFAISSKSWNYVV